MPNQQIQLEARPFFESRKEGETSGGKGDEDTKEAVEVSEPVQQSVTLRSSTRSQILFLAKESISSSIVVFHFSLSVSSIAS